jgi:hypothetical protein
MMRKFIYILFFLTSSIYLNAQLASMNIAVKKPRVPDTYNFVYTGALQQFIVPNRVTAIQVKSIGARGGTGAMGQVGGAGANITTTLNVTPGQILYIVVGGFPGQSATAKYGFGGSGGSGTNYGGAGGGLSGVFTSATPAINNALVIAGGGGGGSGISTGSDYTGGNAGNNAIGTSNNGNEPVISQNAYVTNSRYQYGYAATTLSAGLGGEPFDVVNGTRGGNGSGISGGNGGTNGDVGTWNGGGGGGGGFYGGGGGAGGGAATGGGAGGATKSSNSINSYGTPNSTGDGSVSITCISNSGLVLHLDAGNNASYSGSGATTWNDLSGNGSNVTLTNTTFSSANGGSIVFNGTNAYANFNANIGNTNVVTVEMWVQSNTLADAMYFGFYLYDVLIKDGAIGFNTANSDQYGITSTKVNYLGIKGAWRHLVFVMYAGSKTNNKIYVNGESQALQQILTSFDPANATFSSGAGRISSWTFGTTWLVSMNLANFKVYNRELTAQEITNNFNASSTRFYAEKDGLSPTTASSSAYQIKQDYPNSTDGFYWIKNANINGGAPFKIYADMTTDNGGWTLILKNSTSAGWNYTNAISLNSQIPFTSNAEVINTGTSNYSIVGWADYIKRSASGFQYMIDANARRSYGGIWTANGAYTFTKGDNTQTDITLNTKFGTWNYVTNGNGIQKVMPWYSNTAGGGYALLTLTNPTGNWWGTLISAAGGGYTPAPWISDANGGTAIYNPGIIWYWVR